MHQVVETQGQQVQQRPLQREDRRRDKELLEGREPELPVEDGQHLLLGGDDVAHDAAIVEEAVVIPVLGVEVDLHRHHKVDAGDEDGQKGDEGRDIVIGCPVEQALDLHAHRPHPADDEVGKQTNVGAQAGERQRQEFIHPFQKRPRAFIALGKIAVEQHHVPDHHQAVAHGHGKEHPFRHREAQQDHQYQPQPERQPDGR